MARSVLWEGQPHDAEDELEGATAEKGDGGGRKEQAWGKKVSREKH